MWTKEQVTMAHGVQVLSGRPPQMRPETVTVWRWECQCGAETTIYVTNPKEPVKAFCCGSWHTLSDSDKKAQRVSAAC